MAGSINFAEDRRRRPATPAQIRAIYLIVADEYANWNANMLERKCELLYGCKPVDLTITQASEFIRSLKAHV